MLTFLDLFPEIRSLCHKYKVHLAIGYKIKREPLVELSKGKFKEWQEYQNNKNFEREFILSLVYFKPSQWVFAGIYKKIDVCSKYDSLRKKHFFNYSTELLDIHTDLIGRLFFSFEKTFRQSYVLLEKYCDKFYVNQILPDKFQLSPFPGYENVILSFDELQEIVMQEDSEWKTALSNIKGIYLITDTHKGLHYVGSAYGDDAFWSRWQSYSDSGHGNNIELKNVIQKNGFEYARNFQYSILEIRSKTTDDNEIIERENHWKSVLRTREFGYNKN